MSEMERSVFRQRSIEAMKQKAGRGELFLTVAVGYVKGGRDNIEKDPDRRVQEAVALVFRKFTELQTIRQVLVWLRQEKIPLPVLTVGDAADRVIWRAPVYPTVHHILTNPVYAGAYAFGRRTMRVVIENGRKRIIRSMQRDWRSWSVVGDQVLIPLELDPRECNPHGDPGSQRERQAVHEPRRHPPRRCVGAFNHLAAARCIIFSGARPDRMVSKEVLDRLQPIGVEAALAGIDTRSQKGSEKRDQLESSAPSVSCSRLDLAGPSGPTAPKSNHASLFSRAASRLSTECKSRKMTQATSHDE